MDTEEDAQGTIDKLGLKFPVAYGVTEANSEKLGAFWEGKRGIIQPSEFVFMKDGEILSATYSTGPIGRINPDIILRFVPYHRKNR